MERQSIADWEKAVEGKSNWRDWLNARFGNTPENVIKGRATNNKGLIEANLGDWVVGNSPEELNLAKERDKQAILRNSDNYNELIELNGGKEPDINFRSSAASLERQVNELKALKSSKTLAKAQGADPKLIDAMDDVGQITVAGNKAYDDAQRRAASLDPTFIREGEQLAEGNRLLNNQLTQSENQFSQTLASNERSEIRGSADAAASRALNLQLQQMTINADKDRYTRELARYDRDKRSESIAALIAGLAALGAGFA